MYKKNSILVSYPFKHAYTSKCPNTYAYHYFNCHILGCTIVCYYYFQWKDWPWLWWMGTLTLNFLIKLSFLMYYGATSCWYRCYAFEQEQSVSFCFVQERSCSCWKYATKKVVFITFYMLVLSHGYKSGYWSVSGFWIYGWKTIGFIEMFSLFSSPFICYCFHLPRGWNVVSIHGDKAQQARTAALSLFKKGSCPLMVCCLWNNKILWICKKNVAIK